MIRRPPRSTLFPYTDALPIWEPTAVAGAIVLLVLVVVAAAAPQIAPHDPAAVDARAILADPSGDQDRKSTRLNSSHANISYAVFCLKKKTSPRARPR